MILCNQVKCLKCGDEPFSSHAHDFNCCECGNIAVDGGMSYLKRCGDLNNYQELSIVVDELTFEMCMDALDWCDKNNRNNLGRVCAMFRAIRDTGYLQEQGK